MRDARTDLECVYSDDPPEVEGFPMRGWNISIYLVGQDGEEIPATCFEKATYLLHESFGKRARQGTLCWEGAGYAAEVMLDWKAPD